MIYYFYHGYMYSKLSLMMHVLAFDVLIPHTSKSISYRHPTDSGPLILNSRVQKEWVKLMIISSSF